MDVDGKLRLEGEESGRSSKKATTDARRKPKGQKVKSQ